MKKLAGKNILITGASQGLGRAMALRFAREDAAGLSLVARHIDQLDKGDYLTCQELVIGSAGALWKLLLATERKK